MVKLVRVAGTPYERGALLGEAFADAVARSVAFNRGYLVRHGLGRDALERLLDPYVDASVAGVPHLVEQVRGMAEGAGQPFLDLFFANAFEEVDGILELGSVERCTDVVLRDAGRTLLGHNEQWYAGDEGSVGMVLDVPDDGPALLAPVVAGTLPLVGLNEHGAAFGTMSLSARDERVGVPRALVARGVLDAGSPAEAFARADLDDRAGGYSFVCAFPGGQTCVIESTATTASTYEADVHTNHALDPSVAAAACEPSAGSRSRLARAGALTDGAAATVDGMVRVLADHGADGQDICVHPDPAEGDESPSILFAMICEPESRSLWLAPGHPCTAPLERFDLG